MTLDENTIQSLAEHLEAAELKAFEVTKITDDYPQMDWEDAYAVQWEIRRRKESRGHRIPGLKMGLTSYAKMEQMGVDTPIYGFLADYFARDHGAAIAIDELIHPKVEAEVACVIRAPITGPACSIEQVIEAIEYIVPAVEVIDSRYRDFRFDLKSVIADNASSTRYVIGDSPGQVLDHDLSALQVILEKNGEPVETGLGAAVLGDPLKSVAMLADMLAERGEHIPAGCVVLTGGITAAVSVQRGDRVKVTAQGLGDVELSFV